MRTRTFGLVSWLVAMTAVGYAQGPGRPPRDAARAPAAETSSAVILGRVVTADGGAAVRRAEVAALSPSMQSRTALTDDDGRFELAGLPAGTWYLSVSKTGYLTHPVGARRLFEPARPILLTPAQQATIDVALTRASAIAGRVHDEAGEPVVGVRVQVLRARMVQRRRYLQPVGPGDLTDDTGAFRVHSLPPGEYYVSASLRVGPAESIVQTTHSPTYYPGTGTFAEAQRVLLAAGSEAVVDFPLLPFHTARVTGIVVTAAGSPASAFLQLTSEADELGVPLGIGGVTREDGTFTLPDVPPGNYTLTATLRSTAGEKPEAAVVPLGVYGDDISGVTLVTTPPGSIRGSIVADAGAGRPLPSNLSVLARSARVAAESTFSDVNGGVFELTVPPGSFQLVVNTADEWSVKSILVRGADETDRPLDLGGQQQVPVRIVLTDRLTEVIGTVGRTDHTRVPSVVIFPEDPDKWLHPDRFVRAVTPSDDGHFRITGLPAGWRYLAVAVEALEEGEAEDPEFFSRVRDHAVSFPLGEGEQRVIAVPALGW